MLTNQQQVQEKGKFPSQTQPNLKGIHEVASSSEPTPNMDEVKAVITLRSGKKVDQPVPKLLDAAKEDKEEEPERIVIKEDMMKKSMPPLFPQALRSKKKVSNQTEILEVLRQVRVNIPILDMIKQVPTYAKFLKDLCTVKRGLNIEKKGFLDKTIECHHPMKNSDEVQRPRVSYYFSGYWRNFCGKGITRFGG